MSLRFRSLDDLGSGAWRINPQSAKALAKSKALPLPASKPSHRPGKAKSKASSQPRSGDPQKILFDAVIGRWPHAVPEFEGAVPGRKYRIDIAFVQERLAVEIDGFQYHGKYLKDFQADRERQNLLTVNGWRILRFTNACIKKELNECLNLIQQAVNLSAAPEKQNES
jgi:hypothetical protein